MFDLRKRLQKGQENVGEDQRLGRPVTKKTEETRMKDERYFEHLLFFMYQNDRRGFEY